MHNHEEHQPQPIDIEKGYETSDVRVYLFVWGIAITFILLIAAFFVAQFIRGAFDVVPTASSISDRVERVEEVGNLRSQPLPPGPPLQEDPEQDMALLREMQQFQLNSYGWTNETEQLVHVPIEEAMQQVLAQGALPQWQAPPEPEPVTEPASESAAPAGPNQ